MVLCIFLDKVCQLYVQTLDLGFLVFQGVFDLFDLLLDQVELLIGQVGVFGTELVQVKFLLPLPGCLHLTLFLVDRHIEDLVEIWNSLQDTSLDDIEHDGILQLHGEFVSECLLLSVPLLIFAQDSSISRDDVV